MSLDDEICEDPFDFDNMNFEYKPNIGHINNAQSFLVLSEQEVIGKVCYRIVEWGIYLEYIVSRYPKRHNGSKMIRDLLYQFWKIEWQSLPESNWFWDKMWAEWKQEYSHWYNQFILTL